MKIFLLPFVIIVFAACNTPKPIENNNSSQVEVAAPMNCKITGKVLSLVKDPLIDSTEICFFHPCKALVQIISFGNCGSSVSLKYQKGDQVVMQFAYTLDATKIIFPKMKMHYPGLKLGDEFTAIASQRLQMGSEGIFLITDYQKVIDK